MCAMIRVVVLTRWCHDDVIGSIDLLLLSPWLHSEKGEFSVTLPLYGLVTEVCDPCYPREEPRISDLGRTPFLSTPLSVRKARSAQEQCWRSYFYKEISNLVPTTYFSCAHTIYRFHLPSAIATPLHAPSTPSHTPFPEPTMLTDFRSMMQSFHERLAKLQWVGTIEFLVTLYISGSLLKVMRALCALLV